MLPDFNLKVNNGLETSFNYTGFTEHAGVTESLSDS